MLSEVLTINPFEIDLPALFKTTHTRPGSRYATELERMASEAQALAQPKAAYRLAYVEERGEDWVRLDQVTFTSRVLRVNLGEAQRAFAFVATCGVELEEWSRGIEDVLYRYWSDAIREQALYAAFNHLNRHLKERYQLGRTAMMSPGSLEDWPIDQQRPLFELLQGLDQAVGVQLTESLLMVPVKSMSGFRFPKEETFESCQLCPRPNCPNRRAPYDPQLFDQKYSHS